MYPYSWAPTALQALPVPRRSGEEVSVPACASGAWLPLADLQVRPPAQEGEFMTAVGRLYPSPRLLNPGWTRGVSGEALFFFLSDIPHWLLTHPLMNMSAGPTFVFL